MAIKEDNAVMINTPDGFDARNGVLTKLSSAGIPPKPVPNSISMTNVWSAHPKREAASKPPSVQKSSQQAVSTTSSSSSTREL